MDWQRPPATLLRRDKDHQPISAKQLAMSLPDAWTQCVLARRHVGKCDPASQRCVSVRRIGMNAKPAASRRMAFDRMASRRIGTHQVLAIHACRKIFPSSNWSIAKHRWIIERDYQELKQELGLGHYEGRGWHGFHHHATLCIAAYGFLVAERSRFSPSARAGNLELSAPRRSRNFQPRGSRPWPNGTIHIP